jgi:hypothetical protein
MSDQGQTGDLLRRWLPLLIVAAALVGIWLGFTVFAALT